MEDYAPIDKESLLRCVTSDALKSTPELKKASESVQQERKRKAEEFYSTVYPLAFHYRPRLADPKGRGCCSDKREMLGFVQKQVEDDRFNSFANCAYRTQRRVPATPGHPAWFRYTGSDTAPTQPPELMHRMEAASIKPLPRFSCLVDDVVSEKEHKTVKCVSSMTTASLRVTGVS